jgi:GABA permease
MGRYLVVAHRTLVGSHLLDHCRGLAQTEPGTRFHLVVPVWHPRGAWTDGQIQAAAAQRLDEGLAAFGDAGLEAAGEVGDASPVYATTTALRNVGFDCDGIILSTLPAHLSTWLRMDVARRMQREFDLPVTHLIADQATAAASPVA